MLTLRKLLEHYYGKTVNLNEIPFIITNRLSDSDVLKYKNLRLITVFLKQR